MAARSGSNRPLTTTLGPVFQNQNTQMAGKQTLAESGKGMVHRTRNALGDIGNRLTNKGPGAEIGKTNKIGKSTVNGVTTKMVNFAVPTGHAPVIRGKKQLARSNSAILTTNTTALGPTQMKARAVSRSQSVIGREVKPSTAAASSATLVRIEEGFIETKAVEIVTRTATTVAVEQKGSGDTVQNLEVDLLSNAFSLQRFEIEDIDTKDEGEFMLNQYVKDIDDYLFKLEKRYTIRADHLKDHAVNSRMRAVLMDWIVEVHNQFGFCQETLYMAGKNLDRYLQLDLSISRSQLQLAGVTALYIAVKFEEICVPTIVDFSSVSDNAFNPEDIRNMERKMLKTLKYDLAAPIPVPFLRRFSKACKADISIYILGKYIMELSLIDYTLCNIYPSIIAAGSLAVSLMVLNKKPITVVWNSTLIHYSRYTLQDMKPVLILLVNSLSRIYEDNNTRFQAVMNKYARTKFLRISKSPSLQISHWKNRVVAGINKI